MNEAAEDELSMRINWVSETQQAMILRDNYEQNPSELKALFQRDPEFARAISDKDLQVTIQFIKKRNLE